jgi:hypothetical protein
MKLPHGFKHLVVVLFIALPFSILAQDLNCDVTINADQIQTSDRRVFQDMETAIENFMNGRDWTPDEFKVEERIKCSISINLVSMPSIGTFTATVQIRSSRPVFNTNYESIVFNFADRDWNFDYIESQPLEFNQNSYTTNLTSMLAFYAYVILGMDYDTFGELAGDQYFQIAQVIVNNAAQSGFPGWSGLQSTRNRFSLIEDLTNQQMQGLRRGLYTYHRQGLDIYEEDQEKAQKNVILVLEEIKKIKARYPASIFVISFFDAKTDELVNIFTQGAMQEKRKAFELLSDLNPNKADTYRKILN